VKNSKKNWRRFLKSNFFTLFILLSLGLFLFQECRPAPQQPAGGRPFVIPDSSWTPPLPPPEKPQALKADYDTTRWTEIESLIPGIQLDLRYASQNNFLQEQLYPCGRCFLRPEAAQALLKAQRIAQKEGLQLQLFDCYRPHPVQKKMWEILPNPQYVAKPEKGSMHNRGLAVDLSLTDNAGHPMDMGTSFDYFGPEAAYDYTGFPDSILAHRKKLRHIMEQAGFKGIRSEWWHFSFRSTSYPVDSMQWKCH
jgi:D-alanyl-D-alanine dipeptidase